MSSFCIPSLSSSFELDIDMEKLMYELNLASICFGDELRLEKQAVDRAAMCILQEAAVA